MPVPVANAGGPYSGTAGATTIQFSAAASTAPQGETLTTYSWDFGDGSSIITGENPKHQYAITGFSTKSTYLVTLTVTDSGGQTGSVSTTAVISPPAPLADGTLTGVVISGTMPVAQAHVYLFAANTSGYGNSSNSLVSLTESGNVDANGDAYVISGTDGTFSLTGLYSCTLGQQLYIYATDGNVANIGISPSVGLMAAIGGCLANSTSPANYVTVNEVSTVAMAHAVSGFATDATHISSSGSTLSIQGLANAFANVANLETLKTGVALATPASGSGTAPQVALNTQANILSTCVNPTNSGGSSCITLFANTLSTSRVKPKETATAAINMAQNPAANVAALYAIPLYPTTYLPTASAQPNDFTLSLNFTGGGLNAPTGIAIDGSGNAWVANSGSNSVTRLSSAGANLSGSGGYTVGGLNGPSAIAIDLAGNAWVANQSGGDVTELTGSGAAVSGSPFAAGSGTDAIAIDGSGNVWAANNSGNSVTKLTIAGSTVTPSTFTGRGLNAPGGIAIDDNGNAWIANSGGGTVTELTSSGAAVSGSPYSVGSQYAPAGIAIDNSGDAWTTIYNYNKVAELSSSGVTATGSPFIGGGLNGPSGIAIDGTGNAWIVNATASTSNYVVTEFSNTGTLLSGTNGLAASGLNGPRGVAVDGSGNVWIANYSGSSVTEVVGAGTPVITPLAVAVKNNSLGSQP
jgi:streptogramin lyase